jgi:hypothetical protein
LSLEFGKKTCREFHELREFDEPMLFLEETLPTGMNDPAARPANAQPRFTWGILHARRTIILQVEKIDKVMG